MKKLTLIIVLTFSTALTYGQRYEGDWTLGIGINMVNSNGKQSPWNNPSSWGL